MSENGTETPNGNEQPPVEVTEEAIFSKLSELYPEKIKSREDLDRMVSFNQEEYIKPKNDFVKKANDWNGDYETLVRINKIDPEKMDNKSAIIEDMIVNQGMTKEVAELMFKRQFSAAFQEGEELTEEQKEEKVIAEHTLLQKSNEAKANLSKWKATETDKGNSNPKEVEDAKYEQRITEGWKKPIDALIQGLQELSLDVKYSLADKTEISDSVKFSLAEASDKKLLSELLEHPDDVGLKLIETFGKGDTPQQRLESFVNTIAFLQHKDAIMKQVAETAASKALSKHLEGVKPSGDEAQRLAGELVGKTGTEALIAAWNANVKVS